MLKRSADSPDVVVLPPLLVGSTIVLGAALHFLAWPTTLLPPMTARILGVCAIIASGVLSRSAHRAMQRVGTNVLPTQPTIALALDGPYRFTRNPFYLAAIGVALGIGLIVNGVLPLVLLVPMCAVLHWGVVLREERYLLRKFGPSYATYCSRVRRWL